MSGLKNINRIKQAKSDIKASIIAKGVDVPDTAKIDTYSVYIDQIEQGEVDDSIKTFTGHVDEDGLKEIGWTDEDIEFAQKHMVTWQEEVDYLYVVNAKSKACYKEQTMLKRQMFDPSYASTSGYYPGANFCPRFSKKYTDVYPFRNSTSIIGLPKLSAITSTLDNSISSYRIANFDDFSGTINLYNCTGIRYVSAHKFKGSISAIQASAIQIIDGTEWTLSSSMAMSRAFDSCTGLNVIVGDFNIPNTTNAYRAFYYCQNLRRIDGVINVKSLTAGYSTSNTGTYQMWYYCNSLCSVRIQNLNGSMQFSNSSGLSPLSVHYMIQNSLDTRTTESTAITINLHATALSRWKASDYYAEDAVTISERNITIS